MKLEEEQIVINMPNIKKTCEKCKYGVAITPYLTSCAYFKRKPKEIYYEGKKCPYFRMAINFKNEK